MALTIALDTPRPQLVSKTSSYGIVSGTIAFDSSYPTGGESAADITKYFKSCFRVICDQKSGYFFEWDKTNSKILVYGAGATAAHTHEIAIGSSSVVADGNNTIVKKSATAIEVAGTGTAITLTSSEATPTASAAAEVSNEADLSLLVGVSFIAFGTV